MSDFFGGILDGLRGSVTDASSFFGKSISDAALRGIAGGGEPQYKNANSALGYGNTKAHAVEAANSLSRLNNIPDNHSPYTEGYAPSRNLDKSNIARPEDYITVEQAWLQRLHRFGQIDAEIQSGKVNEGVPR